MARAKAEDALEQKIEKAQERVIRTRAAYDEAVDNLQKLLDKKAAIEEKKMINAIKKSEKSYEEIMAFLTGPDMEE